MSRTSQSFNRAARSVDHFKEEVARDVLPEATRGVGAEVKRDVDARRVPVASGALRRSGVITTDGKRTKVTYGGPSAPHALVVHEDLTAQHAHGEARYLIRGVDAWGPSGSAAMRGLAKDVDTAARSVP